MVDVFLIIFVVIVICLALAVNIRTLFYYQRDEESGFASSLVAKTIIVVSLTLCWLLSLLLPVDVRNSRPVPGLLDMHAFWVAGFISIIVFIFLIIPGAMYYSEIEDDEDVKRKRCYVFCQLLATLIFLTGAVAISYPFLSIAELPMVTYDCSRNLTASAPVTLGSQVCDSGSSNTVQIQVGLEVYLVAVICFLGWFFFAIYGGIGLSAAPLDMILSFVDRPRPIGEHAYQLRRRVLGQAAQALLVQAEELKGKNSMVAQPSDSTAQRRAGTSAPGDDTPASRWSGNLMGRWSNTKLKRQVRADYNKWKAETLLLEEEFDRLQVAKFHQGELIIISALKLLAGILFAILTIMWILHIILYIVVPQISGKPPPTGFLNDLLSACESGGAFPVGVTLFGIFTLYLLYCVMRGCLKFGMRIFVCFSVHPMRYKATPLNSILFNVQILLISCAAVIQFNQTAFASYARLTQADVIFSAQVRYLKFYSWFFKNNVFIYTLLVVWLLSTIYLMIRPRDRGEVRFDLNADKQIAKIAERGSGAAAKSMKEAGRMASMFGGLSSVIGKKMGGSSTPASTSSRA